MNTDMRSLRTSLVNEKLHIWVIDLSDAVGSLKNLSWNTFRSMRKKKHLPMNLAELKTPGIVRSLLTDADLSGIDDITDEEKRWHTVSRRATGNLLLSWYADRNRKNVVLGRGPHGKPECLSEPNLHFNATASGFSYAIGFSLQSGIGIDLEMGPMNRATDWLAKRKEMRTKVIDGFFLPAETKIFGSADPGDLHVWHRLFLRTWTRKEAVVKAWGESIGSHSLYIDTTREIVGWNGQEWRLETTLLGTGLIASADSACGYGWLSICTEAADLTAKPIVRYTRI